LTLGRGILYFGFTVANGALLKAASYATPPLMWLSIAAIIVLQTLYTFLALSW